MDYNVISAKWNWIEEDPVRENGSFSKYPDAFVEEIYDENNLYDEKVNRLIAENSKLTIANRRLNKNRILLNKKLEGYNTYLVLRTSSDGTERISRTDNRDQAERWLQKDLKTEKEIRIYQSRLIKVWHQNGK